MTVRVYPETGMPPVFGKEPITIQGMQIPVSEMIYGDSCLDRSLFIDIASLGRSGEFAKGEVNY